MSGKRIVEETPCDHGETQSHVRPGHRPTGSLGQAGLMYANESICPGGSCRVLTEGQYVLIEKVDGEWDQAVMQSILRRFKENWNGDTSLAIGEVISMERALDALSDHTEGTP